MDLNDYVHELRETQQITTKQLSFGLCAASTLRNYESGQRDISIFLVNRLLERLGAREGHLQYFLSPSEYHLWETQLNIIAALYKRELTKAEALLSALNEQKV